MVPAVNKTGGSILAGMLVLLLVLAPRTAASLTPAGTVISHSFTAQFAAPAPRSASSSTTQVTVHDLADPSIVPSRSVTGVAGKPVDFLHTVTNRGNSTDSFRLRCSLLQGVSGPPAAGTKMIFYASDGITPLPADASGVQVIGPLAAGTSLDVVLRVTPLAASQGTVEQLSVTATSTSVPSRSSSVRDELVVAEAGGVAPPVISVDPSGSVLAGSTLYYSIRFANTGVIDADSVQVTDLLTPMLDYLPGSATFPAGVAGTASFDTPARTLTFHIPKLAAGARVTLGFRALVRGDTPGGSSIVNAASLVTSLSSATLSSDPVVTPVVSGSLRILKLSGSAVAEAGDLVPYTVQVENAGAAVLTHVTVVDRLPRGFRYLKGSSLVDGTPVANPTGAGELVNWDLGTMEIGAVKKLSYRCAVTGDAPAGVSVNVASASAVMPGGAGLVSPQASAGVKVRSSLMGDKAIILGRVFEDSNGNGLPDFGELGMAGVRVYLEDGSYVVTDKEGQYSFTGVAAGSHVVKIERSTLAPRYRPVPYNTAFAGVGWSQFVTVPFGGPARGDFALEVKQGAVEALSLGQSAPAGQAAAALPREWLLVGLGNLSVGARGVSGRADNIHQDDRFQEGFFHEERLAFFTRGTLLDTYLLTAAYDSKKERRDGVFQSIDPEKYYPVYGDATDIGYQAQSRGKFYFKLESGRSYLLAGDYRTDLSENEFSRYDRALNGVKVEMNSEHLDLKGFESRTEESVIRDQIPGNGTSGYYFLSRKPVFENSERVRIEIRDRYHSERLVSVAEKIRYADYTIDYNAGTILFKEPVPSLDQYLNPVTIVINYQSQTAFSEQYVYGGRALLKSATGSYLGATGVVEQETVRDTTLYGLDAGWKIGERFSLKGEGAVSDSLEKGRGSAYKTELSARPFDSLLVGGYYRKVDASFFNSSMTGHEAGTNKYGGRLDYRGLSETLLFAESFVQKDEVNRTRQFGSQAGFLRTFSLWETEGGFKSVEEEKNGGEGRSNLLYAGIKGAISSRLDGTLRRDQLLFPSTVAEYQSRTFLKLDYRLSDATNLFLTEEYQEGHPELRQATRFGMESRLSEKMRLTTGYQLSSGTAGSTAQSSVDLNSKLFDREAITVESRTGYQVENSLSQERGQAILGLNSRYRLAEGILVDASFERVQTVQGKSGTRTAFTLAGEYLRRKDLKVTGRYEIRTGPGETASLYNAGFAYQATGALTLLGKGTFSDKNADAGQDRLFDGYLGSSFRPLAGNPLQLLSLLRYKIDDNESAGTGDNRWLILSNEGSYRLVKEWIVQGKYAGKFNWDSVYGHSYRSYTDLILAGISYDLAERWELSLYLKLMNQYQTGQHSYGSVASAGYRVYRNVVLSAGYNYARLDDKDLTGESFQGQGPFFGIKVKFDEDMFESAERKLVELPPARPVPVAAPPAAPVVSEPQPPPVPVLWVAAQRLEVPLRLSGSAELFSLLVNGEPARLPSTAVTVTRERLEGSLDLEKGKPARPVRFLTSVERPELVSCWSLDILDGEGKRGGSLAGRGAPPHQLTWGGGNQGAMLREGEIYQYQLTVTYQDGSVFSTGRELFGVNRKDAVLLTLAGGAFVFDTWSLTAEARRLLKGAARVLRSHPAEKVIVEGHTDGIGTVAYNIELSRKRCNEAADYLVREEGIPASRLIRRWYGKSRPLAGNGSPEGRKLNRRVELKGDFAEKVAVAPKDRYRASPFVLINDRQVPVDRFGRFETTLPAESATLKVQMGDSLGRSLATTLPVPGLRLAGPAGERRASYGSSDGWLAIDRSGNATCTVAGEVDAGTTVELQGAQVPLDSQGRFTVQLPVSPGEQLLGVVLRNAAGCSKLMNLRLRTRSPSPAPKQQVSEGHGP